jgi:hypothetical protein
VFDYSFALVGVLYCLAASLWFCEVRLSVANENVPGTSV